MKGTRTRIRSRSDIRTETRKKDAKNMKKKKKNLVMMMMMMMMKRLLPTGAPPLPRRSSRRGKLSRNYRLIGNKKLEWQALLSLSQMADCRHQHHRQHLLHSAASRYGVSASEQTRMTRYVTACIYALSIGTKVDDLG